MRTFIILLITLWVTLPAYANLTPEQQEAKQQGMALWNAGEITAVKTLEPIAKAGDLEAQYALADALVHYITGDRQDSEGNDAFYWFTHSAEKGFLPSMLRMGQYCWSTSQGIAKACHHSQTYWSEQISKIAKPKAEQGDTEAMLYMYAISGEKGLNWLKKAAKAGNAEAQYQLAKIYSEEASNAWLFSANKEKDARMLLKESADKNYPPAQYTYSAELMFGKEKNITEGKNYLIKAVDAGYLEAIEIYANALYFGKSEYEIDADLVKAYVFLTLLNQNDYRLKQINLTPEQQKEAEQLLKERKENYPPLSEYKSFIFYKI